MKGNEVYRLPPRFRETKEERLINNEVGDFLRENYLEMHTTSPQYMISLQTPGSMMLVTHGEDICHDTIVDIQVTPKGAAIPKELTDMLTSKGFVRVKK